MSQTSNTCVTSHRQLSSRGVLAILVAFFGLVFTVNGFFIYSSLATHTGVVAEEPYRKGLGYNARIAAGDRQTALNWSFDLDVRPTGTISLALHDQTGTPVTGRHTTVVVGRPATNASDRTATLSETAPGMYAANLGPLAAGSWIVEANVRNARNLENEYRLRRRLWLTQ